MSGSSPIIRGSLTVKVHGLLKSKQLPGQWGVLYDADGRSGKPPRIELFEAKNDREPVKVIQLQRLRWVDKSYKHTDPTFEISIKKEKHHFSVSSLDEKEDWVHSLCHVDEDLWKQRSQDRDMSETDDGADAEEEMSENLIYDSCDKTKQFKVSITSTKASEANGLKGHFFLMPTRDTLRLLDNAGEKCIHEWPYRHIRKYGRTKKVFQLEVGRKCTTGEGNFLFFTPEGQLLVDLMGQFTREMAARESEGGHSGAAEARNRASGGQSPRTSRVSSAPQRRGSVGAEGFREMTEGHAPKRSSTISLGSKRESPKLSQRQRSEPYPPPPPSQENGFPRQAGSGRGKSSDTKIYETQSGLTAPLAPEFKTELHGKLRVQVPEPDGRSGVRSQGSTPQSAGRMDTFWSAEARPEAEGEEDDAGRDRKKGGKDSKKKREKEQKAAEAKAKKEREREQKEREREQKEREKKMKKEKGHEKLRSTKSSDAQLPLPAQRGAPHSDSNIYDEPGELLGHPTPSKPSSKVSGADPLYEEPGPGGLPAGRAASKPQKHLELSAEDGDTYATPSKPKKDAWKEHARPESSFVQQEDYSSIKLAAQSQPKDAKSLQQLRHFSNPLPNSSETDELYDHLGAVNPRFMKQTPAENIYGMASAVQTIQTQNTAAAAEPEYEDTNIVTPVPVPRKNAPSKPAKDGAEETSSAKEAPKALNIQVGDGDYADVE